MLIPIFCFIAMAALGTLYQYGSLTKKIKRPFVLILKAMTTLTAFALAVYGHFKNPGTYAVMLSAGVLICAAADVLLEKWFVAGMGVFALGHLCYILGFLTAPRLWPLSPMVLAALFMLILLLVMMVYRKKEQNLLVHGMYAVMLSLMLVYSLSNHWAAAAGAALFMVSDSLIAYRLIIQERESRTAKIADTACIALYYLGQFLLALSVLIR